MNGRWTSHNDGGTSVKRCRLTRGDARGSSRLDLTFRNSILLEISPHKPRRMAERGGGEGETAGPVFIRLFAAVGRALALALLYRADFNWSIEKRAERERERERERSVVPAQVRARGAVSAKRSRHEWNKESNFRWSFSESSVSSKFALFSRKMVDSFSFFISWLYECLDGGIGLRCNDGHINPRSGDKKSGRVISNNTSSSSP